MRGSTTATAAAVATAASKAFPPSIRTRMPAIEASGSSDVTIALRPVTSGRSTSCAHRSKLDNNKLRRIVTRDIDRWRLPRQQFLGNDCMFLHTNLLFALARRQPRWILLQLLADFLNCCLAPPERLVIPIFKKEEAAPGSPPRITPQIPRVCGNHILGHPTLHLGNNVSIQVIHVVVGRDQVIVLDDEENALTANGL